MTDNPSRWAPDNAAGLHAYVISSTTFGRTWDRIEYAQTLGEARRQFGWTRAAYTTIKVRRATPADMAASA